jgi:hypothetical protein
MQKFNRKFILIMLLIATPFFLAGCTHSEEEEDTTTDDPAIIDLSDDSGDTAQDDTTDADEDTTVDTEEDTTDSETPTEDDSMDEDMPEADDSEETEDDQEMSSSQIGTATAADKTTIDRYECSSPGGDFVFNWQTSSDSDEAPVVSAEVSENGEDVLVTFESLSNDGAANYAIDNGTDDTMCGNDTIVKVAREGEASVYTFEDLADRDYNLSYVGGADNVVQIKFTF